MLLPRRTHLHHFLGAQVTVKFSENTQSSDAMLSSLFFAFVLAEHNDRLHDHDTAFDDVLRAYRTFGAKMDKDTDKFEASVAHQMNTSKTSFLQFHLSTHKVKDKLI